MKVMLEWHQLPDHRHTDSDTAEGKDKVTERPDLSPIHKDMVSSHGSFLWPGPNAKRTRQDSDGSDSGTERDITVVSPAKRMKKPSFVVKGKEMQAFFRLLGGLAATVYFTITGTEYNAPVCFYFSYTLVGGLTKISYPARKGTYWFRDDAIIFEFLHLDCCTRVSDKYLLAMVFAYFKRADFAIREYTRMNFFVALYLANDMEEDEEDYKYEVFPWALGKSWKGRYMGFLRKRDKLWARIGYRAVVSRKCCEEVMALEPNHFAWRRERPDHHAGAIRNYARDDEEDLYPVGPDGSPRQCKLCQQEVEYDSASPDGTSWYLSSCSDSSDDSSPAHSLHLRMGSRFDMEGLKLTLQEDEHSIWAHEA